MLLLVYEVHVTPNDLEQFLICM